jgi:serine/threonine protein kinase
MSAKVDETLRIVGYQIVEQLYSGSRTHVYRAVRECDTLSARRYANGGLRQRQPVVIKLLKREYPSFSELVQFRNQYAIANNLDIPGIIKPYNLEPYDNGYVMVMEDFGGISLRQFTQGRPLVLEQFLAIALQLLDTLHQLHQQRVIHKDIKPANILIHPDTKQIKLIDFSIASLLPRETQEIQSLNGLEGTLAYLSPEQTGRMNRGIDYRSDFYSLGVTFFELLSGQLPFDSHEPMELVHCHIAKVPPFLCDFNPDLPLMLGEIVRKLMAKNAEDRYQSSMGIKHDLVTCLEHRQETGKHTWFDLGQRDISDRFLIPEKLYGRESEVQTLLEAFGYVANGGSQLMLVAGFSGIGKTAVVNEVHKPIVRWNGYFIKGKYDQFNRNIPLSAFVQAFRDLMGQLLSESDTQLEQWQKKILAAVGENGQVLIEVIPELEQMIGKQPAIAELSGGAAQNRFNLLFQKFIQVFTTREHPLVMFLDDLQWADSASLNLLKLLMSQSDSGYLFIIGAYRDNEVFAAHPLMLTIDEIEKASSCVNTLTLAPLSQTDVNHLIADSLSCSIEQAWPLTELVYQKAKGNPFFTTQFLKALHDDGLITFDWEVGFWQCDVGQVRSLALTDDVVEFMTQQLQKLPDITQDVLKLAACIGNQFDLATLAIVSERVADSNRFGLVESIARRIYHSN